MRLYQVDTIKLACVFFIIFFYFANFVVQKLLKWPHL